ncbi:zinc ABC transporter substrate-binding protein [Candidatus Sumerlaeota bacterium]|nr:zinc ABC transporter substrate-binding protein [Candidatus Sumerlaeota bacterium]
MKRLKKSPIILYITFILFLFSCSEEADRDSRILIGVTTSYLECAVRDIAGDMFDYVRIAPPGMCPGHFDLKPSQVQDLKKSVALFRFDFQNSLDEKMKNWNKDSLVIYSIKAPEGLCIPDSYRLCLKEVYENLRKAFPEEIPLFASNYNNSSRRLDALEKECRKRIRDKELSGARVIASGHQEVFSRWLGLDVIATYSGGQSSSLNQLREILDKGKESGIRFIIANEQEGRQQAEALASHLRAPLVFFSNFPDMTPEQNRFDLLVRSNLDELERATQE